MAKKGKVTVSATVNPETKEIIVNMADKDNRKVANMAEIIIEEGLKAIKERGKVSAVQQ